MSWTINYLGSVKKDLQRLDTQTRHRIRNHIENMLSNLDNPRDTGEALVGSKLGKLWKFRVGDYRIIAEIQDNVATVLVIKIGHRKEVYK